MELIRAISFPKGTGIRHGVLDDHGRFLYMISEDSCEVFEMNMEPVSYTHLDVYKRQVQALTCR